MGIFKISLFILFVLLLFNEVLLHPARTKKSAPDKRPKPSCFYGVTRHAVKESQLRVPGTIVSTDCHGELTRMGDLVPQHKPLELFGAPSLPHLVRARGSAEYDDSDDFKGNFICKSHIEELYSNWGSLTYKHVRRTRGDRRILCSYPFEEHDVVMREKKDKIHHISYQDARKYLEITGRHIHPGTTVCHDHYIEIQSVIESASEKEIDEDYCPVPLHTGDTAPTTVAPTQSVDETVSCAFFTFAQIAGFERVKWRKSFDQYRDGTKRKKAGLAKKIVKTIVHAMAPDHETELEEWMYGKINGDWDSPYEAKFESVMEVVNYEFLNAPTKRMRDFVLSIVAGRVSFPIMRRFIPSLSVSKYQRAQKIALSGNLHEIKESPILERYDYEAVSDLIQFITGPLVLVGLPMGVKHTTTSKGEDITIPNTIRMLSNAETVHQFQNAMNALGRTKILSASSIIRLLNAIPADTRRSAKCVDQFVARGFYAFEDIFKIINRLYEMALIDKEEHDDLRINVMELQLYLRSDYKLHTKKESFIAEHCYTYALSDPNDDNFREDELHSHEFQCPRCAHLVLTFRALNSLLLELISQAIPTHLSELKEYQFQLKSDQQTIEQLRNHELRSMFSNYVQEMITQSLTEGQCKLTLDFAQRWDPSFHLEEQQQYYTKGSGHSMHFSHALCKLEGQFVQHTWIHLIETGDQDSLAVIGILEHVMTELHKVDITLIHIRSDNGAPYHSALTIGTVPFLSQRTGVSVASISFSEACHGKGPCDRMTAVGKDRMRRELHKGLNVDSYSSMFDALISEPMLKGVTVVLATIDNRPAQLIGWKLDKISNYGYFQLNSDDTMTVWKYYGIGKGLTVSGMTEMEGGVTRIVKKAGILLADPSIVQGERAKIAAKIPCAFWINDVKEERAVPVQEEPLDSDDEIAKEPTSERNVLHYCWCGSSFIRFKNLMNHLEWGTHKICPEKTTMIDLGINMFKRTVEDFPAASLLPIQDAVDGSIDHSVPISPMGFALRSKRRGGRLPEAAKKIVVDYFWKMKKEGKSPVTQEAFNILNQSGIPPDERLTYQQIKSLYGRMWRLPIPSSRARRNQPIDEEEEIGEWEQEWDEICDPLEDVGYDDILDKFIHNNLPRFFDTS